MLIGMAGCGGTGTDESSDTDEIPIYSVSVTKTGTGAGKVVSLPSGIDCGAVCEKTFPDGTSVTLTPTPAGGSMFSGWSGDPDCADGSLFVNAPQSCIAKFDLVELVSILVTPENPAIGLDGSLPFAATGTFTDNSTQDLTGAVTWASGQPAATISDIAGSKGVATGVFLGQAAITATDVATGISNTTTLTVADQTAPVVTAPASITVSAVNAGGTPAATAIIQAFLSGASATDNIDGPIAAVSNNAPPATFALGTTTVTFRAVDLVGNSGSASATVTVTDQTSPVVTAPAQITLSAVSAAGTPATNGAIQAFLSGASASDNVDGVISVVTNDAPTTFPLGSTTVTFSAVDLAGNSASGSATVTVTDQTSPVVTSPAQITLSAVNAGGTPGTDASIQAFLSGASASDNVDGAISVVTNDAPATFPLGNTTVTFTAVDGAGNTGTGTSQVTVADQTSPVVTASPSIVVAAVNSAGVPTINTAIQTFLNGASAVDNVDGAVSPVSNNAPAAEFPLGTTTVTFSVVDAAGNTGIADATVTVTDQTSPVVTAPASVTVSALNSAGTPASVAVIQTFLTGASAIDDVDGVISSVTNDAPATFPLGNRTVTFTAVDVAGNTATATAAVTVTDQTAPILTAPASITVAAAGAAGTPAADAAIQAFLNAASATDNVDGPITAVNHNAPLVTFPVGATIVTFSAADAGGNTGTITSTVTVLVEAAPVVTAPASITVSAVDASGTPAADAAIQAFLSGASATDEIDGPIGTITNDAPATTFPPGTTTVTFSATDSSGNTSQAQGTVTVSDQTPPAVTAPGPVTVPSLSVAGTPRTNAAIQAFLNAVSATDNVDGSMALITNNAPATFPQGPTTVTFTAVDAAGNAGTATALLTVIDETAPVVTAPASITVSATDASGTSRADPVIQGFLNSATALDNVDGVIASVTNDAPAIFLIGTTTVTFSAVDSSGTSGSRTSQVTVADRTAPLVTAPASITAPAVNSSGTPLSDAAIQTFLNSATAFDNVDGVIASVTNNAPATFPQGTTTVTFTAVDGAGNGGSSTATVTVSDQTAPVVTAPASISVPAADSSGTPASDAAIQTFLSGASASDNVDGSTLLISNNAPISRFPVGTTVVTFSAVDGAGNPGSATASVTVADQTAPVVTAPVSITVPAVNSSGTPLSAAAIQTFLSSATAADNVDGAISVVTNNAPVTFPLGSTTVTFSATDSAGISGSATASVTVTDQTKPVISLLGVSPVDVSLGTAYVDAGASASDLVDGDLTAAIVTVNPVNTSVAATYFVTYDVTDSAGNAAVRVSRTVNVKPFHPLTVTKSGTGTGTVTSAPSGISCGADCTKEYPRGAFITLSPVPDAGSVFSGWSGDADCVDSAVTMSAARGCTAAFDLATVSLSITRSGAGSGLVTSSPAGINCDPTCGGLFIEGSSVTLAASSLSGSGFGGWTGVCAGAGPSCTLTLNSDTIINADFHPAFSISGFISGAGLSTTVTLKDSSGAVIETTPAAFGSFTFSPRVSGNYTVIPASSAKTAPKSRSVTLADSGITGVNFTATHTITGTVTYAGAETGHIYIGLHYSGNRERNGWGTSVQFTASGTTSAFTIRGVPAGTYDVEARLDQLGSTIRNVSNPVGMLSSVSVGNADVAVGLITLLAPGAVTPQTPFTPELLPLDRGALFLWEVPKVNAVEIADSYRVYYRSGPADVTTTAFDKAVTLSSLADGAAVIPDLVNGTRYSFIVTALFGGIESAPTAVVSGTPAVPAGGVTFSGAVSFPAVPATPGGSTLYTLVDDDAEALFIGAVSLTPGDTSASYTLRGVQPGSYTLKAFIDVGNDGIIENPGDLTTGLEFGEGVSVTVGSLPMTGQDLTISGANAFFRVRTVHGKSHNGSFEAYTLAFQGASGSRLPTKMVIAGGDIPVTDLVPAGDFQGEFYLFLPYELPRPVVGASYTADTSYLGDAPGTVPESLTASVTAVLDSFPVPTAPVGAVPGDITPLFTWSPPAVLPAARPFAYDIWVGVAGGSQVWRTENSLPDPLTSIMFNDDGSATTPSLTPGTAYLWNITVRDIDGNEANLLGVNFTP